jgi:hypothetical protein
MQIFKQVQLRWPHTFDSSATPEIGKESIKPTKLAEVDLSALSERMRATIQKAKENNPAELKRRIADLEREMKSKPSTDPELVERYEQKICDLSQQLVEEQNRCNALRKQIGEARTNIAAKVSELFTVTDAHLQFLEVTKPATLNLPVSIRHVAPPKSKFRDVRPYAAGNTPPRNSKVEVNGDLTLKDGERKVLVCAAQYRGASKETIKTLTGYRSTSIYEYSRSLVQKGAAVWNGDVLDATPNGIAALGHFEPLPTGDALVEYWQRNLSGGELRIFEVVLASGGSTDKGTIMERTSFKSTSTYEYCRQLVARRVLVKNGDTYSLAPEFNS